MKSTAVLLGLAFSVLLVNPTGSAPVPDPSNCLLEAQGVDSDMLSQRLNQILSIVIQLLYNDKEVCKKQCLIEDLEDATAHLMSFIDRSPPGGQMLLTAILRPLIESLGQLMDGLAESEGVLQPVEQQLSQVINTIPCVLHSLGLCVDVNLIVQIGKIVSIDLDMMMTAASNNCS